MRAVVACAAWSLIGFPARHGIDERLIIQGMKAGGDSGRLTMRVIPESRRSNIGHPNLDWPQTQGAQPLAM